MRKSLFSLMLSAALLCGTAVTVQAQQQGIAMPAASPISTVTQKVGLGEVTVTYSRPSVKGRSVFGGDIVPHGKLWRTGANASTKIKFSEDVTIQGNKIPAGEYALYTIPNQNEWTIVIHKNTKHWGDGGQAYKQEEDQARFTVKPQTNPRAVESFTINFANLKPNAADLEIMWDKTIASFTIESDVDSKVMAQIQERVVNGKDVPAGLYASAATYYYDNDKDMKQALEWIKKANANEPKFWYLHTQAKIQAKMKDYKGAVKTAEQSMAMAKKENNDDYVRMNEKAIAEWKKMK
ncbi:DUF2911 domain-containing protein [Pontibacter sp. JH31]|uniref:DUF2911 domain-containing protein n=1 Tax=Pontibacter aquaedesilientis TaxID=2766980 RepID=A0ABR7XF41_9BACT|nr:DUF2911 domain-containing protein [Pontibacter aquaedesilientis]MBD1396910.1 DUF2911 domain-containing protein [Pontibacter aquaedesilientis]